MRCGGTQDTMKAAGQMSGATGMEKGGPTGKIRMDDTVASPARRPTNPTSGGTEPTTSLTTPTDLFSTLTEYHMSTDQVNIFEQATRLQLRFRSKNGMLSTEDLWNLSLQALDDIAKSLRRELRDTEESFIEESKKDKEAELRFSVAKHIIDTKLAERDERKKAKERAEQRQRLLNILERKQDAALEGKTIEEIQKELDALGG